MKPNLLCASAVASFGLLFVPQTGASAEPIIAGCGIVTAKTPKNRELIRDPHFRTGFRLIEPKPGQRVVYGRLAGLAGDAEPAWDLDQWSSRFPLAAETPVVPQPDVRRWANAGKAVTLGAAGTAEADLSLAVNATVEYEQRARKSGGEPWVHLLVEQYFAEPRRSRP